MPEFWPIASQEPPKLTALESTLADSEPRRASSGVAERDRLGLE